MAGRRNPFEEIEELMNRMSRQFEESMGGSEFGRLTGGGTAVDVADRGDEFVVTADLPGYRTEDVEVSLRGEQLHVEAEREEESEESAGSEADESEGDAGDDEPRYIRKERRHQSVSRSITLPDEVEKAGASAQFRNGVLTVTLPKAGPDDEESTRIDVS